ncbi:MAG: hypothetical protein HY303_22230 [Candidatus Wallbacteria bacterium]|nr:hypothetical protein [Candidatus Wallbacteria bacterium]
MKTRQAIISMVLLGLATRGVCGAPPAPRPVFDCRVPLAPLMAKLRAAGGDVTRILYVERAVDLTRLKAGARYKFSLPVAGRFAIGPEPAEVSGSVYSHPILSGGRPVLAAGGIRVDHEAGKLVKVTVDQDSQSYCPTADCLQAALESLAGVGVPVEVLRVENRTPECVENHPNLWPPIWVKSDAAATTPTANFSAPAPVRATTAVSNSPALQSKPGIVDVRP